VLDRAWDDEFLDGFLAIETWGSDNVSFPGACYARYVDELYRKNALVEGRFSLTGDRVRLEDIEAPLLTITFGHDHIVPPESARVLLDKVSSRDKHHIHLPGGHVGAVVSRSASKRLWPLIDAFFAKNDSARPKRTKSERVEKTS
jgi:polyhydroxyalkanoate synthase